MSDPSQGNFDQYFTDQSQTAASKRAKVNETLRSRGINVPFSTTDIYDLLDNLLSNPQPDPSRGDAITHTPYTGDIPGTPNLGQMRYDQQQTSIDTLINALTAKLGGVGPKPGVLQGINDQQAFDAYKADAVGPAPSEVYQKVFANNFKAEGQGHGPFDQFVQQQEPYLQKQFLTQAYQDFSKPGVMDQIKSDYMNLQRQGDSARVAGQGGELPSFEDFIKQRVNTNYESFLQGQQGHLAAAYELASPTERYGYRGSRTLEGSVEPRIT